MQIIRQTQTYSSKSRHRMTPDGYIHDLFTGKIVGVVPEEKRESILFPGHNTDRFLKEFIKPVSLGFHFDAD